MNVEANGREFAYIRRGQGEPLLLIQGMGAHHDMWGDWFLNLLEPQFDVVAYSQRGISTSSRADEPFTTADLADDAASVISALGWRRAHIFGISLGGMVAQELALRHPSLIRTLTIGCSWAGGPAVTLAETARRMVDAMATRDVEHAVRTGYEANLSQPFAADPANFTRFTRLSLAQRVPFPVVLMQWEAAQNHAAFARLPSIAAPTLVLHGTADAMMPAKNGSHIASLIPGCQLAFLPGAGHLFWWEQPEETANLLIKHAIG
jgi:pimeloyl-ACP methyl ester carboxylesterase